MGRGCRENPSGRCAAATTSAGSTFFLANTEDRLSGLLRAPVPPYARQKSVAISIGPALATAVARMLYFPIRIF